MNTKIISKYWDKQASIWSEEKQEQWDSPETQHWLEYFKNLRPTLSGNRVLEVGTASGYFANILSLAGYEVTAIDFSTAMIEEAKKVSKSLGISIDYHVMDAQNIQLPQGSFDLVFTRLMTWNLPDVPSFYKSSFELLKSGGALLNFDGDFGKKVFSQEGHEKYPSDIMEEANTIKSQLEISKHKRSEKDVEILTKQGFTNMKVVLNAEMEILHLAEKTSLFELRAVKP